MQSFSWYVGFRYLRAKRRTSFMSFLSTVSMAGMVLGVTALIIVLSVMNGFEKEMREKVLSFVAHSTLSNNQPLQNWRQLAAKAEENPAVAAATGTIEIRALINSAYDNKLGAVYGVDTEDGLKVTNFSDYIASESMQQLADQRWGIIMGKALASRLGLTIGDQVEIWSLEDTSFSLSGVKRRAKNFTLIDTFEIKSQIDEQAALISLRDAATMKRYPKGAAQAIQLKLNDMFAAIDVSNQVVDSLEYQFGQRLYKKTWIEIHGSLYNSILLERRIIALLLSLIVAVASFNILTSLMMVVNDKQGDIAILRTMGATPGQIMWVFLVQGSFIGIVGTLIGAVIGSISAYYLDNIVGFFEQLFQFQVLPAGIYFTETFPSDPRLADILLICAAALILSVLVTIYPALKAASVPPAEALRYEI